MRLGDLDALKERMFNYYGCVNKDTCKGNYRGETLMNYEVADMIEDCIDNAPTVDAVPVVRCEKCVYHTVFANRDMCTKYAVVWGSRETGMRATKPNHFCADGERRMSDDRT